MPSNCRPTTYIIPSTCTAESDKFAMQKSFRNVSVCVPSEFSTAVISPYPSKPIMQNNRSQCISGLKAEQIWHPGKMFRWNVQNSTRDRSKLELLIRHCGICRSEQNSEFKVTFHLDMASCWLVIGYARTEVLSLALQANQRKCKWNKK